MGLRRVEDETRATLICVCHYNRAVDANQYFIVSYMLYCITTTRNTYKQNIEVQFICIGQFISRPNIYKDLRAADIPRTGGVI